MTANTAQLAAIKQNIFGGDNLIDGGRVVVGFDPGPLRPALLVRLFSTPGDHIAPTANIGGAFGGLFRRLFRAT